MCVYQSYYVVKAGATEEQEETFWDDEYILSLL
jgi:hypothetical protein